MDQQKKIQVVIADNETRDRQMLTGFLKQEADIHLAAECKDGRQAVRAINEIQPDWVILDVPLPIFNGFEVLEKLEYQSMPVIVFATSQDNYAVKAFEYGAIDYIVKPLSPERMAKTLEKVREKIERSRTTELVESLREILKDLKKDSEYLKRVVVKENDCYSLLNTDDIYWIDSSGNYVDIHTHSKRYQIRKALSVLYNQLDPMVFQRISRFSVVNIHNIKKVQEMSKGSMLVYMKNNQRLPLAKKKRKEFMKIMDRI